MSDAVVRDNTIDRPEAAVRPVANSQLNRYKDPNDLRLNLKSRNMQTASANALDEPPKERGKGSVQPTERILQGQSPKVAQIRNLIQSRLAPIRLAP